MSAGFWERDPRAGFEYLIGLEVVASANNLLPTGRSDADRRAASPFAESAGVVCG